MTLQFGKNVKVPESACTECGGYLDMAQSVEGDQEPTSGDATICIHCGSINVFDENLKLRKPTEEEFKQAEKNSDFQKLRMLLRGRVQ